MTAVSERAYCKAELVRLLQAAGELRRSYLARVLVDRAVMADESYIAKLLYDCRRAGIVEQVRPGVYRLIPGVELVPYASRREQVEQALEDTPGLTGSQIAQALGVVGPIVYNQLRLMERAGVVRREGAYPARWYLTE
jgi:hypothetical protein